MHQRAFSAAGGPHYGNIFLRVDMQTHIVHGFDRFLPHDIGLAYMAKVNHFVPPLALVEAAVSGSTKAARHVPAKAAHVRHASTASGHLEAVEQILCLAGRIGAGGCHLFGKDLLPFLQFSGYQHLTVVRSGDLHLHPL